MVSCSMSSGHARSVAGGRWLPASEAFRLAQKEASRSLRSPRLSWQVFCICVSCKRDGASCASFHALCLPSRPCLMAFLVFVSLVGTFFCCSNWWLPPSTLQFDGVGAFVNFFFERCGNSFVLQGCGGVDENESAIGRAGCWRFQSMRERRFQSKRTGWL